MPLVVPDPVEESASIETVMERRNTDAFIAADPVSVFLRHYDTQRQASGGRATQLVGSDSVTFRLIPQSDAPEQLRTTDGRLVLPKYVALGKWDAPMRAGDRFEWNGSEYQLSAIHPTHGPYPYETKADVVLSHG